MQNKFYVVLARDESKWKNRPMGWTPKRFYNLEEARENAKNCFVV